LSGMSCKYNNPGFAWPTLDGIHFADVPDSGFVSFKQIQHLESAVKQKMGGIFDVVVFPTER
jgi:hypothetical protein